MLRTKYEGIANELKDVKQQRDNLLDTIKKKSVFEEKYYEKIQQVEKLREDLDGTHTIPSLTLSTWHATMGARKSESEPFLNAYEPPFLHPGPYRHCFLHKYPFLYIFGTIVKEAAWTKAEKDRAAAQALIASLQDELHRIALPPQEAKECTPSPSSRQPSLYVISSSALCHSLYRLVDVAEW